jgi:hypothetical protein
MRRINLKTADFAYDADDPEGYRTGLARLGPLVGAAETGTGVYEIPAEQSVDREV